ncbi:MAG: leucine--tRNA ligase [Clostridiales bacterium]|jgi:leucyl-tRNA synthetase|nr:leucine--tRNA ligase [Clostridiales bacterium]
MNTKDRKYNFRTIEQKWRDTWKAAPINTDKDRPKFYCLDMFPYPSGDGLHVGHWRSYVISDVLARYKLLQGHYVIHPMGFDSFGLPAENFAIEHGIHPEKAVAESSVIFKRQLEDICAMYDWDMELSTTDPAFYKWTQWIFVQMYKEGLAYEKEMPLNWCPACKVVLANEEAAGGECERCGAQPGKKNLRQWMLKITNYAERLLADLDMLNWPDKVKKMQADWIGKSYGAKIDFAVDGRDEKIQVFTTRPDTLYGATFMVLAPEHGLVKALTTEENREKVEKYVQDAGVLSNVDRMAKKDKTGVFTGSCAINPLSGERLEIWISDYVLADYGTGAIMCVPGHDQRDFEFAKKFGLPIIQVIAPDKCGRHDAAPTEAYTGDGFMVNSGNFNGLPAEEGKEAVANHLEHLGIGEKTVNYKLRDWVFSRQRYWGEPIPLIHCEKCGVVPVPESDLPVMLPHVDSYKPTDTGESPLALIADWVNTKCPACGGGAKRETNTMPQWAGSSWYFLRYVDVNNDSELISRAAMEKFLPVDYYVGGIEHAVLHLLYVRFYTKFLYDIGVVNFQEPFTQLFNQGMINRFGMKMSKSKGNGVSPDELITKYGCDALRLYILFLGPPELDVDWNDNGIEGVFRFLNKLWRLVAENADKTVPPTAAHEQARHKMIYDISTRMENLTLNTVVSGFMEHTNKLTDMARQGGIDAQSLNDLIVLIAPFAPHIAAELWEICGRTTSVFGEKWPMYDKEKMAESTITVVVQINGKLRENIQIAADAPKDDILAAARASVATRLDGQNVVKEIFVPGKLVNFVVK